MVDSETLQTIGRSPDHHGAVYSIETIRQGTPEPTKQLIADVYTAEFRLHVTLLRFQGFMSQIRKSFRNRIKNQITNEFRYYPFESGKFISFYYIK